MNETITNFQTELFTSPSAVQQFRIQELSAMFLQIRGGLGNIENKIRTIQAEENLSAQQKVLEYQLSKMKHQTSPIMPNQTSKNYPH